MLKRHTQISRPNSQETALPVSGACVLRDGCVRVAARFALSMPASTHATG
jgi:hypothetical protein